MSKSGVIVALTIFVAWACHGQQDSADFANLFEPVEKIPVMFLGSYHMSNPGADMFNLEADDVLLPKRQAEITAVVERLAAFKPTRVAVEAPYGDSATVADYEAYIAGKRELRRSEEEQIGFRLAHMLGHKRVYPIDVRMGMDDSAVQQEVRENPEEFGPYLAQLQKAGQAAIAMMAGWLREGTIGHMLYRMNDPAMEHLGHELYFRSFVPVVSGNTYAGADMVSKWYQRNMRIFSNLHKISGPKDRIIVIYGQGHVYLLKQFAEESPYFRVEDVRRLLKGL